MALTKRGKIAAGVAGVAAVGLGILFLTGNAPSPLQRIVDDAIGRPEPCPLTGLAAPGAENPPDRPLLAVKIENAPSARPQSGLEDAEVVYEEPVEGGLTRFIALYHCANSERLGPVRSARLTDPDVLAQFGRPLFAYAGSANKVEEGLAEADLVDLNYTIAVDAYTRDPSREAPHNLYSTTRALRRAGRDEGEPPAEVFVFAAETELRGKRARLLHLPFSLASDVYWSWGGDSDGWLRAHGSEPHVMESGEQVRADTVVVMHVPVTLGTIKDAAGARSPEVTLTGSGDVWIMRDGRAIAGRWERDGLSDVTRFTTRSGEEIPLRPGVVWVELLPDDIEPEFTARV